MIEQRFPLGRLVITPGALDALNERGLQDLLPTMINRHALGDWGDLDECDKQANEEALIHGDRILSHYKLGGGRRIYIITEHDRSSTCIMLPEEY